MQPLDITLAAFSLRAGIVDELRVNVVLQTTKRINRADVFHRQPENLLAFRRGMFETRCTGDAEQDTNELAARPPREFPR